MTARQIEAVLDGIKAVFVADVTAEKVMRHLAERRAGGLSIASSNHYLRATKSFLDWLVRRDRAPRNALTDVGTMNADADRRHVRRALDVDELRALLAATADGPERYGMSGAARALLYRVAVETGLRAGELRSLTRASFDLNGDEPTVTVAAGYSKHRRDDTLPLRSETAAVLGAALARKAPQARVFNLPEAGSVAAMLRADLDAARVTWIGCAGDELERELRAQSAFLRYRDDVGRVCDFHALRHTFITNLVRGGVTAKDAQQLARHSTVKLTIDRYAHTTLRDQRRALESLPALTAPLRPAAQRTGTYDAPTVENWTKNRTNNPASGGVAEHGAATVAPSPGHTETRQNTVHHDDSRWPAAKGGGRVKNRGNLISNPSVACSSHAGRVCCGPPQVTSTEALSALAQVRHF